MTGIYKVTNKVNGKCYIGQSKNIARRFWEHRCISHESNPLIRDDLQRYGKENFAYEVLEECGVSDLDEREAYYIAAFKPEYNTKGLTGQGIHYTDQATRDKIRKSAKRWWNSLSGETKERIIKHNLKGRHIGYRMTAEQKDRLSKANLGKKQSAETIEKRKEAIRRLKETGAYVQTNAGHKKSIVCLNDNMTFESVKSAAEAYGIKPSSISAVLNGRQNTAKGLRFKYL